MKKKQKQNNCKNPDGSSSSPATWTQTDHRRPRPPRSLRISRPAKTQALDGDGEDNRHPSDGKNPAATSRDGQHFYTAVRSSLSPDDGGDGSIVDEFHNPRRGARNPWRPRPRQVGDLGFNSHIGGFRPTNSVG